MVPPLKKDQTTVYLKKKTTFNTTVFFLVQLHNHVFLGIILYDYKDLSYGHVLITLLL